MIEIISNLLIHREFTHPFPAKFVIERNKFFTENSSKPQTIGLIDPSQFSPYPKNPLIARVFREIGRADKLGSGLRKLFRYCKLYQTHLGFRFFSSESASILTIFYGQKTTK